MCLEVTREGICRKENVTHPSIMELTITMTKIRSTSLFIHQVIQGLLKQKEAETLHDMKTSDKYRQLIGQLKTDKIIFGTFREAMKQKFPFFENLIMLAISLHRKKSSLIQIFWTEFFHYILKICFIHPNLFISGDTVDKYPLYKSIEIISCALDEFVMLNVRLSVEMSSLTSEDLQTHNRELDSSSNSSNSSNSSEHSRDTNVLNLTIPE
jgi:hypothetical protein